MTIYVINPNSTQHVTDGIDHAVDLMRQSSPVSIVARTLAEGPPGIETQAHIDGVIAPLLAHCEQLEHNASAFVVACYSDPGLMKLREQSARPVIGIAEASILTAMTLGQKFGIISILSQSIPRHKRYIESIGVTGRLAEDQALELGVLELADEARTFERLKAVGTSLRDKAMADVIILGCAGMTSFRTNLENHLGIPVVEPCQAATAMAISRVVLQKTRED